MSTLTPFRLEPLLVSKPWGGQRLARLGRSLPADALVGESWDLVDLDASVTDVPDAVSRVRGGDLDGALLHDVVREHPHELLGPAFSAASRFPLLVKHIDAREHLSVQVHPTPELVAAMPGTHLKTESWVVVEATPGSELMMGLAAHATPAALEQALGTPDVAGLLNRVPAQVGDVHHVPPGVVHALGAGVVVAEVQSPSDTTFRLYDWAVEYGRTPRALHTDEALASVLAAWQANLATPEPITTDGLVVEADLYRITRQRTATARRLEVTSRDTAAVVVVLSGRLRIPDLGPPLERSELAVLPAAWSGEMITGAGSAWIQVDLVA
jgi:mannose-6-phosphate isomerase